ncbi:MAG: 50S ribosomal protein L25 [Pseudomonadota bacterium]
MAHSELNVTLRKNAGKNFSRAIRRDGLIPTVYYGKDSNILLSIDPKELYDALSTETGENTLLRLHCKESNEVEGRFALIKEIQKAPISRKWVHADLVEIQSNKKITVTVATKIVGKAIGLTEGGILHEIFRSLKVVCLPENIPSAIELDVTNLKMGDILHLNDIKKPNGCEFESTDNISIISIATPAKEVSKFAGEGGESAADEEGEAKAVEVEGKKDAGADNK